MPCSASSAAVPPVEMISTPSSASARAKSTTPRLSNTLSSARSMRRSPAVGVCRALAWGSAIVQHPVLRVHAAGILRVDADGAQGDQPDGTGEEPVLGLMKNRQDLLIVPSVRKRYCFLQDDGSAVDSLVHEVD